LLMTNVTRTSTSHYEVQKKRRAQFIEDWRGNQRTVIAIEDVEMLQTDRGLISGAYIGPDADKPTRTMDGAAHEIPSGVTSTIHRHSWDAMMFCVGGNGWTEIDGVRINWGPGDSLHLPAWAWHRHGNEGEATARYMSFSSEPLMEILGFATLQDEGDTPFSKLPGRPPFTSGKAGNDPYARRIRRLAAEQEARRSGRLHTSWDELEFLQTPRGTRTTFLLDRAVGYQASGITMAMFEIGPGRQQSMHRHPGEAWLYVVEGKGHSFLGTEPDKGENHPWKKGDLIIVDHFLWHQHINDDPDNTAKVVRIHMFDTVLETMRALCDPLVLFEEPPDHIRNAQAGDLSTIVWPEVRRPTWP
jgi:gentisate 1,2-dioxygenase